MGMRIKPIDRYNAVMAAASRIAAVLLVNENNGKPIEEAVTLAFELESEVASELGFQLEDEPG